MNTQQIHTQSHNNLLMSFLSVVGMFLIFTVISPEINAQAYIYEHANYQGRIKTVRQDTPWIGNNFNDIASSLVVSAGTRVILYEHANYQGRYKVITRNTPWIGNNFNDIVSSIRIQRIRSNTSVNVRFVNQTPYPISIYWVSGGQEKLYRTLSRYNSYNQQTYVGHQWRIRLNGRLIGSYSARQMRSQAVQVFTQTINAGPIWNQRDAEYKCNSLARNRGGLWTGQWRTTIQGRMSVCELTRVSY